MLDLLKIITLRQRSPNCFVRGPHKLLHNSSGAEHLRWCEGFGIRYILPNQQVFRRCGSFSLLTNYPCGRKTWLRGPDGMASRTGCNGFTGQIGTAGCSL